MYSTRRYNYVSENTQLPIKCVLMANINTKNYNREIMMFRVVTIIIISNINNNAVILR